MSWHDKPGTKLRWYDFVRAIVEVGYIWRERVSALADTTAAAPDPSRPNM